MKIPKFSGELSLYDFDNGYKERQRASPLPNVVEPAGFFCGPCQDKKLVCSNPKLVGGFPFCYWKGTMTCCNLEVDATGKVYKKCSPPVACASPNL